MFDGFERQRVPVGQVEINLRRGGQGPPLLLLHGYPQTHVMWHAVAPGLASRFTVVAADLRGYGDSSKPPSDRDHAAYSKRTMAADMVAVMRTLGWTRFSVVGHDRGGRVGYRMALDHPDAVARLAVLDIVPTATMWAEMGKQLALATYHWAFLAQPDGLPERLIGADPAYWLQEKLRRWSGDPQAFTEEALGEYLRCFADPEAIRASCDDYRAGAGIDDELDRADRGHRRIGCPLLVLWGRRGTAGRATDPLAAWREWADDVQGHDLDCGHFLAEEAPEATLAALDAFL